MDPSRGGPSSHVHDAAKAFAMCLGAPEALARGQVFNVGGDNYRKVDLVELPRKYIPELHVEFAQGRKNPHD